MASTDAAVIALSAHLRILSGRLSTRHNEGPEALLADLIPTLVVGIADICGRPGIDLLGQPNEGDVGRPDFSVKDGRLLIGHVETKAPGRGADPTRFRDDHGREQWGRFKNLPNLLYTDGTTFGLFRSGERVGEILEIGFDPGDADQQASADDAGKLVALLTDFLSWKAVAPTGLASLAEQLAPLCAVLRDSVRRQLDAPGSEVAKAAREFEGALFPGRSADEIADAFAQVCTYSMLLARAAGAGRLDATSVERTLRTGHPVLGRIVRVLLDEFTEQELSWALEPVRTLIEVIDFERLRQGRLLPGMTHHDQTWLYFYEAFLARYDPELRAQYGVYYTPQQVIQAQVALVDDLLRSRLGLPLGFASPEVTVLDPAVGTGSYPIQVVTTAAETARAKLGEAATAGAIKGLADSLFAFEVLAGPYAVAHLRLSEAFDDFGAAQPGEAVNVFLTDTLSSPWAEPTEVTRLLEPLVEEQRRALQVKADTRILICLGNPPYERGRRIDASGQAEGGWVVSGDGEGSRPIFDDFLEPLAEARLGGYAKNLYNDYVYFWRWALWKVFEHGDGIERRGPGVVSFITASSYLAGDAFAGMREHMRRICDEIWIVDLGGDGRGARREENVFAIQTPVAVAIAIRSEDPRPDEPAVVRYTRISGSRAEKLDRLASIRRTSDIDASECPSGWQDPFMPAATQRWTEMTPVTDVFPWQHSGVQTKRTWIIAPLKETLQRRWQALLDADDRRLAMRETDARNIATTPAPLTGGDKDTVPIAEIDPSSQPPPILRYGYRPFDRQWLIADNRVIDRPRPELWRSMSERQVFMVSFLTAVLGEGPAAVATSFVPDLDHFRGSFGGRHVIPLYESADGTPNLDEEIRDRLERELEIAVSAEDVFAYAYAILSSPRYVERFFDELRQPGPRLPLTADATLWRQAVERGSRLLWLHTYGQRMTADDRPRGALPQGAARVTTEIPTSEEDFPESVGYDPAAQTIHVGAGEVGPIAPEVWEWSVSGLRVVESWVKYRLREGAGRARRSSSPLDAIRPPAWPQAFTVELLELLWLLEATVAQAPEQAALVDAIADGPLIVLETG